MKNTTIATLAGVTALGLSHLGCGSANAEPRKEVAASAPTKPPAVELAAIERGAIERSWPYRRGA
jgi:hypothetical protein